MYELWTFNAFQAQILHPSIFYNLVGMREA